MTIPQAGTP